MSKIVQIQVAPDNKMYALTADGDVLIADIGRKHPSKELKWVSVYTGVENGSSIHEGIPSGRISMEIPEDTAGAKSWATGASRSYSLR